MNKWKLFFINFVAVVFLCSQIEFAKASPSGVPIGIFLIISNLLHVTEKTIAFLNNGIKYGRNKWSFRINVIKTTDSNEVIRAC